MQGDHIIHTAILKSCLITIQIICILFIDGFYILIQHCRMKDIIMIKQTDIITGCHFQTFIGIA